MLLLTELGRHPSYLHFSGHLIPWTGESHMGTQEPCLIFLMSPPTQHSARLTSGARQGP